jgi:hypothetical protein
MDVGKSLALTAATGLVAGLWGCGGAPQPPKEPSLDVPDAEKAAGDAAAAATGDKDCCKGKNECKGKGNCKTDTHDCGGKNECKGQGGCKPADCK